MSSLYSHWKYPGHIPADEPRSIFQGNQPQQSLLALAWRVNFGLHRRRPDAHRTGPTVARRNEILTSKACELLQCSITDLNRWTADGRLSIFRIRAIQG